MAGYDHHLSGTLQTPWPFFFFKISVQKELGLYQTLVTSGGKEWPKFCDNWHRGK